MFSSFGLWSDPWSEMRHLEREMNRLARNIDRSEDMQVDNPTPDSSKQVTKKENDIIAWRPRCDLKETENTYEIHAELPGVKKEDVTIDVQRDCAGQSALMIHGKKDQCKEEKGDTWHRTERSFGEFSRSFVLPEGVDPATISAKYENGVLTVGVPKPKVEEKKEEPHRIEIK